MRRVMPTSEQGDYVLGTHGAEMERLGLQHRVWRDEMLSGWDRAGIGPGARVIDIGSGPGFATIDLSRRVGPDGEVFALERSPRFTETLRSACREEDLKNVTVREADVMDPALLEDENLRGFDFAWCRWIACFLPSLDEYTNLLHSVVRPGGRVITHEYAQYRTWQFLPPREHQARFVDEVIANWRTGGSEPDVAGELTAAMSTVGFRLIAARPMVFTAGPGEPFWEWPVSFMEIHARHLQEIGRVSDAWAEALLTDLESARRDPHCRIITPLVAELVFEKD